MLSDYHAMYMHVSLASFVLIATS